MGDAPITSYSSAELLVPGTVVVNHRGDGYLLDYRTHGGDPIRPGWAIAGGGFLSDEGLADGPWSVSGDPALVAKVKEFGRSPVTEEGPTDG